ncbi:Gx transporter family protein [Alkalibacter rhizosphaerae]|uniref:Gx transporter family protein n=1 Tax=Alkalibacter rhizosphaerae TaxID=2815577 RepID=A0A974XFP3_9FIRM|nr:Gx transporter family protein [Alkalibacter rhizosphaerae]QSX08968.1 Gx transporter family protein [Alkalibacter rhizosphaerae]
MNNNTKRLVFISMLVTQAMILSYIETLLPAIPIQGAKLGLANIATVLALSTLPLRSCLLIVVARTFLTGLLFGNMASIIYSISGGILSLLAMFLMMRMFNNTMSLVSVSILGAIMHNLGQLGVAMIILENSRLIVLLPYLFLIAIPTGLFVGMVSKYLLRYLSSNHFNFKTNR